MRFDRGVEEGLLCLFEVMLKQLSAGLYLPGVESFLPFSCRSIVVRANSMLNFAQQSTVSATRSMQYSMEVNPVWCTD